MDNSRQYLRIKPKVKKIISNKGKQKVKMNTLKSKVKCSLVAIQIYFLGNACNWWLRCNNGMGVEINPALKMGRNGSKIDSQIGSLGINPISKEAGASIFRRFVPKPGPIISSSTGNGLKFGLGALVNIWIASPTMINIGKANKNTSIVHIISQISGSLSCKIVTKKSFETKSCVV